MSSRELEQLSDLAAAAGDWQRADALSWAAHAARTGDEVAGMTWATDMGAVQNEAGGLLALHVIRPEDTQGLILRIIQGDPEAEQISHALWDTLKRIKDAPRRTPMLCAACPRTVRRNNFVASRGCRSALAQ